MERGYIKITEEEIGKPVVEVKIVNGTVWMFKHEIARLFDVYLQTVGNNFRSIFKSGVLCEDDVTMERKMKNEKGQDIPGRFRGIQVKAFDFGGLSLFWKKEGERNCGCPHRV